MLYLVLVFLVVGLVAGVLGISRVAAIPSPIAWVRFLIGVVMAVTHFAPGGAGRVS